MNVIGLVWSNLFRRKTRTILTLMSVLVAFVLFTLLRSVAVAFSGAVLVRRGSTGWSWRRSTP